MIVTLGTKRKTLSSILKTFKPHNEILNQSGTREVSNSTFEILSERKKNQHQRPSDIGH